MTHGLWDLRVKVDGETIVDTEPKIGYLHRCHEKIYENRTYPQIVPISDRLCYGSSMSWSYTYVHTVEELMGVEVPEKAEYIRIILLEIQRIASHLMWLAAYGGDLGIFTMLLYPMRERELFQDILQSATGNRLLYNYPRIGGVRNDLPRDFGQHLVGVLDWFDEKLVEYEDMLDESDIFRLRNRKVGVISGKKATNLGVTGPTLRGSGVKMDLRKDDPYSIYDRFDFKVCTDSSCDCWGRYRVRMDEMRESSKIIRQAVKGLPRSGEIQSRRVPRNAPKRDVFVRTEDPRGEAAMYIVGDGTNRPYRVKIKSPMFINMSALPDMLIGYKLADVPAICGSIDVCMGETDR
jgi:NADH-quinone oxidoreductase subunit D